MTSTNRHDGHNPAARSGGVAAMDDPITAQITREVAGWKGVSVSPHRFGGVEFKVGRRELGHLHGSRLADLPFPRRIRDELVESQRVEPHHVLPDTGWVSFRIRTGEDVPAAIALFRLNYERPWLDSASVSGGGSARL